MTSTERQTTPDRGLQVFADLVRSVTEANGDRVFLPRRDGRDGRGDRPVTFTALRDDIQQIAAGLAARGIGRGDHVALIAENCSDWLAVDLACATLGIADVPRGTDTAPLELVTILRHSGCRFAFAEHDAAARSILAMRDELPDLEAVCVFAPTTEIEDALTLDGLRAAGRRLLEAHPGRVDELAAQVQPDDLLTIVYTSGTTAEPKGVMLSHANVMSNIETVREVLHFDSDDVFLSVLPAWHAYERVLDYVAYRAGAQLVYTDRRRIKEDLAKIAPTAFAAVPRIWESIHDGIVTACCKKKPLMAWFLRRVLRSCQAKGAGRAGLVDRVVHRVASKSILPKFRAAAGGRLRVPVSGGGALPAHIDETLIGMGLSVLNGYGLTETSPVASVRVVEDNRAGTIGRPLPRTQIEIRDESGQPVPQGQTGLVWIKGPQVMQGYYKNPERTQDVLRDGWFNSGDLGHIEADGHIKITGRAKDTIVLAGGENVEPEHVEAALKTSRFIDQAIVLGQDRKTLGAILVPHLECLELEVPRAEWDERDGVLHGDAVKRFYRGVIDSVLAGDKGFRPLERVATFRVLTEPLTIENGLLTQTLKVKRHKVVEHHGPLIEQMW